MLTQYEKSTQRDEPRKETKRRELVIELFKKVQCYQHARFYIFMSMNENLGIFCIYLACIH